MSLQLDDIVRQFLKSLMLAFLTLLSITCSDNPTQPQGDTPVSRENSIIPLAVGNEWQMKRTQFALNGDIENVDTLSFSIDSVFTVSGHMWYHFNPDRLMSNRPDGLWQKDIYQGDESLWRRYPAKVGDTTDRGVHFLTSIQDSARMLYIVVATDTMITVPAGSFRCVEYQMRYLDRQGRLVPGFESVYNYSDFYSPGVGFILTEQFDGDPGGPIFLWFRRELMHVTLH